ncbi:membrane-spanning protein [Peribacillus sp. SCS-155]|uniref:membrane-spanning protein n=1 Tax=Peribacillus sedimenti TaxID=3115297 RepID=UPI0039064186
MKRKLIIILSSLFIVFMAVLMIYYINKGDASKWQVALGGTFVSALPLLLLFKKKIPFNAYLIVGFFVFIFCSSYLGSIAKFYLHYKWWDTTLHVFKGLYVGFFAIALYKLLIPEQARSKVSRTIVVLFVLSLAISSSALWEIYEYAGDLFYTDTMQRGGNKDTMYDLLAGLAGGLLVAIYASLNKIRI